MLLWTDISDYPTPMDDITCMHSLLLTLGMCKSTGTTGMTRQLAQQPKILAESTCKSMVHVENEWQ